VVQDAHMGLRSWLGVKLRALRHDDVVGKAASFDQVRLECAVEMWTSIVEMWVDSPVPAAQPVADGRVEVMLTGDALSTVLLVTEAQRFVPDAPYDFLARAAWANHELLQAVADLDPKDPDAAIVLTDEQQAPER
jgi:hypothetical protein